jgi:hypothetical protein
VAELTLSSLQAQAASNKNGGKRRKISKQKALTTYR